jgi:hypothetical protein
MEIILFSLHKSLRINKKTIFHARVSMLIFRRNDFFLSLEAFLKNSSISEGLKSAHQLV